MAFKWIEKLTQLGEPTARKGNDRDELGMALAILMLEVAKSDFQESDSEIQSMTAWLKSQDLGLSHDNVTRLLDSARGEQARSAGLFKYTRRACEQMSM